jgi:uncharacterized integral membrane protein
MHHRRHLAPEPCFTGAQARYATAMLYTILIVLAIIALLMFIFGYRRV